MDDVPMPPKSFAQAVEDYGGEMERLDAEIDLLTRLKAARQEQAFREIRQAIERKGPSPMTLLEVYDEFYWDHFKVPAKPLAPHISPHFYPDRSKRYAKSAGP